MVLKQKVIMYLIIITQINEVEQIKESCHFQLNLIPNNYLSKYKSDDYIENLDIKEINISIERMSGSIKLKKINQSGGYLKKISQNFFSYHYL